MSIRELAVRAKKGGGRRGRLLDIKEIKRMKRRGYGAERELVKKLRDVGFKAVRIPVSAPSKEPLPDVFATKGDCLVAIEVKAPRAKRAYFYEHQVEKLFRFLDIFAVYPKKFVVLAAKFPYRWVLKLVDKTDKYVIRRDDKSNFLPEKVS